MFYDYCSTGDPRGEKLLGIFCCFDQFRLAALGSCLLDHPSHNSSLPPPSLLAYTYPPPPTSHLSLKLTLFPPRPQICLAPPDADQVKTERCKSRQGEARQDTASKFNRIHSNWTDLNRMQPNRDITRRAWKEKGMGPCKLMNYSQIINAPFT